MKRQTLKQKVVTLLTLQKHVADLKRSGKRIVTTNGCFDIIHPGHVKNLAWARAQGDVLIVGINSDASVRRLKGKTRPIVAQGGRAQVLAALACVDYVFVFNEERPWRWISQLQPDVHVKGAGSERSPLFKAERKVVEAAGGTMRLAPKIKGYSTTRIINRILSL